MFRVLQTDCEEPAARQAPAPSYPSGEGDPASGMTLEFRRRSRGYRGFLDDGVRSALQSAADSGAVLEQAAAPSTRGNSAAPLLLIAAAVFVAFR